MKFSAFEVVEVHMDVESTAWPRYVNAAPEELLVSKQVRNVRDIGEI